MKPTGPGAAQGLLTHLLMVIDENRGIRMRLNLEPYLPRKIALSKEWYRALQERLLWKERPCVEVAGSPPIPIIPVSRWVREDRPWELFYE